MLTADHLEQFVTSALRTAGVPGLAIAIVKDGNLSYERAFGVTNTAARIPLTPQMPFQAASLSKPVFAYGVLELCERGVMNLDTPLSDYWSDPSIEATAASLITPRHVLSHTTGFPNWR